MGGRQRLGWQIQTHSGSSAFTGKDYSHVFGSSLRFFCEAGRNVSSESFNPSRAKNKFKVLVVNARHTACQFSEMTEGKGLGETTQL